MEESLHCLTRSSPMLLRSYRRVQVLFNYLFANVIMVIHRRIRLFSLLFTIIQDVCMRCDFITLFYNYIYYYFITIFTVLICDCIHAPCSLSDCLIHTFSLSSESDHEAGSGRFCEAPRRPLHHRQLAAVLQHPGPHGEGPLRGSPEGADQLRGQHRQPHPPLLPSDAGLGARRQGPSQPRGVRGQRRAEEPVPGAFSPGLPPVERGQPEAA